MKRINLGGIEKGGRGGGGGIGVGLGLGLGFGVGANFCLKF